MYLLFKTCETTQSLPVPHILILCIDILFRIFIHCQISVFALFPFL